MGEVRLGIHVAHVLNVPCRDFLDTRFLLMAGAPAECRRGTQSECGTLFLQATFSRNPSYRLEPVLVQFSFSRSKTLRAWEWDFTRTSIGLAQSWKAIGSLFSLASIADWMDLWVGPSGIFAGRTLFCVLPVFRCAHRQTFALFVRME